VNLDILITSRLFQIAAGALPLIFFASRKIHLSLKVLLISSFVSSILLFITGRFHINNLLIFNTYQVFSILSLSSLYFNITQNKLLKRIDFLLALITSFVLIFELTTTDFLEYSIVIEKICFVMFAIVYFFDFVIDNSKKKSEILILVNTALFIYYSFSFLFNIYIDELMKNNLWFIHNFIEGSSKLLIAYAFWKQPKTAHY
jgi:hypothetical protein